MKQRVNFIKNIFFICFLIIQMLLFTGINYACAEGNRFVLQTDVHVRKGFMEWGNGQFREYKFNNIPESGGYLTMFPIEKFEEETPDSILDSWNIEYFIYTTVEDAELAMVERLEMSSLFVYNIIDHPLTRGQIGDNCWYQLSAGVIQFLRNNVYASVSPKVYDSSFDTIDAEWLARKVDTLIMESEKVYDVAQIPAPEIHSVEIVSALPEDWEATADVKVNATDPKSQKLLFRKYATGFAIVSETGTLKISFNKNTDLTEDSTIARVKIWVWNEDNIVASTELDIPF